MSEADLYLMRIIDEIHLNRPFLGSRRIRDELVDRGHNVGRGHVRTLMLRMGIHALYRKPRLSKPHPGHRVFPYLLRGVSITRANQVWAADITYIPMAENSQGILLSHGGYGLGEPPCFGMAAFEYHGHVILSGRP